MRWEDEGILLAVRRHGENAAIIDVLTAEHGRHAGVVRGGTSRKIAPVLQPGAQLAMTWTARLESHIGTATVEPLQSRAVDLMQDRLTLSGLNAVTALLGFALPERDPQPEIYAVSVNLLDLIGTNPVWPLAYLKWETALLEVTGFGLDLSRCAVSGQDRELAFVSPKSGRAVSRDAAGQWADRLLPLGPALRGEPTAVTAEIVDGLRVTGHFLENHLAPSLGDRPLPQARARFLAALERTI